MRFLVIWVLVLGLSFLIMLAQPLLVQARDIDYDFDDLNAALASAPQGIPLSYYFDTPESETNSAVTVKTTNPESPNTEAVQLTNGAHQLGTLWSNDKNTFDLNRDQTVSMWLYFGHGGAATEKGNSAGDGMAFVLQNDGKDARTKFKGQTYGETLGVWGVDEDNSATLPDNVAFSAIQKSWALEFDTYVNEDTTYDGAGKARSFDIDQSQGKISFPHIASNYPGSFFSYELHTVYHTNDGKRPPWYLGDFADKRYYYSLRHEGLIQGRDYNFLSNEKWHHLTLRYTHEADDDPRKAEMQYTFDDKDPQTGVPQTGESRTVQIDKDIIDPDGLGTARWGFTGSTGGYFENNLVVFDQIPDLVDATAEVHLTDVTQGKELMPAADEPSRGHVTEGDQVTLDYKVCYLKGKSDWHNVVAKLKLPKHLTFESGTITPADGSQPQRLSPAALANHEVAQQIADKLDQEHATVHIHLTGTVDTGPGLVAPATSNFNGMEAVEEATTPGLVVDPLLKLAVKLDETNLALATGQSVAVGGHIAILDGALQNPNVTLQYELNGVAMPTEQALGEIVDGQAFQKTLSAADLQDGSNELCVTAIDDHGNKSLPVKVHIFKGQLDFGTITKAVNFHANLTGQATKVYPTQPFDLTVADTRTTGSWQLTASVDPLQTAQQNALAGQLEYVTPTERLPLSTTQQRIAAKPSTVGDTLKTVTAVAGDKTGDRGLLLQLHSSAVVGHYSGEITWTLANTITA